MTEIKYSRRDDHHGRDNDAFLGVLSVALTDDAKSAPPLIADLVPGHNQTI
jgi:hypothetical protein